MSGKLIIVAGPTASGKSALALGIARAFDGTIINADSMQVYRDLRILTARPDDAALAAAPHRLDGILDGAELCSAARWAALAHGEIAAAHRAGRLPIVVGGTGLYLRTLLQGIAAVPEIPDAMREAARARHREVGGEAFRVELARLDPAAAGRLPAGDSQRLVRAYEVVAATGRTLGDWQRAGAQDVPRYDSRQFVLLPPRDALYAACDGRLQGMIAAGALDEVAALIARGLSPDLPICKAVGVPELVRHLAGELDLATATAAAQQATRNYAKRQFTWFRRQLADAEILDTQLSHSLHASVCQKIRDWT
ncbi:MAG TPA: tRNA (adenosine(37)-N6)-dimethylallyltransferase MiaA [Aliidongia sp.]|uniref:tRNA (adenosine(37)-N6)-dimethylallyltransferase MiaA n=1 Tax=Aliidongia sp. TaxID=1914230 RepID=UPI002DDCF0D6|nr:tRNA (adenosine(37)-N6)-dimethylallyltransferase MiaA [Aliidongia sp.]HEV2675172.1 tRNA (adenosine(37)-N6)-dimethylallyltransferase MiaA [Aliidongia sp.]